ncbi:MAG TPA: hypothetical protein VJ952_00980 [Opitutales bacterium]|nr:hypothetical protein [Opitutales bacterium]
MKFHKLLYGACLLFLGASLSSAESTGKTIQFRALALEKNLNAELYYKDGSDYILLPLSHYRPSTQSTAACDDTGKLLLFEKLETEGGKVVFQQKVKVAVPNLSKQVLLLAGNHDDKTRVIAVEDNLSGDDKDWLFINTTKSPMAFQIGDANKPFPLPPWQSVPKRVQVDSGKGAAIRVAAFQKEEWKRVYSTYWPIYDGQRALVICVTRGNKTQVLNFFDVAQPGVTADR